MANAAIALDHLNAQTFGDLELRHDILALFLRQTESLLELMRGATPLEARDLAHKLKGSARAVGAFGIADAAEHFETALNSAGARDAAFAALAETVERARPEIQRLLIL